MKLTVEIGAHDVMARSVSGFLQLVRCAIYIKNLSLPFCLG